MATSGVDNLTEMIARRTRQNTATWGARYSDGTDMLEDRTANYYWQPDSFAYNDAYSGRETWVTLRNPGTRYDAILYTPEYGGWCWSYNGAAIAAFNYITGSSTQASGRYSKSTAGGGWGTIYRPTFIVRADGSKARQLDGKGSRDGISSGGFPWANTELAYYGISTIGTIDGGASLLYKNTVDDNNLITVANGGNAIIDLYSASGGQQEKGFSRPVSRTYNFAYTVKRGISNDDLKMIIGSPSEAWGRALSPVNGVLYVALNAGISPTITSYWGVYRPTDTYGGDILTRDSAFHAGSSYFIDQANAYIVSQYEGNSQWWKFKLSGTDTDGGPKREDWNAGTSSYGGNEIYPISYPGSGTAPPGWYDSYWGHPQPDLWGVYILTGSSVEKSGTRIIKWSDGTGFDGSDGHIETGVCTGQADGGHHSWTAWADAVVWNPAKIDGTTNTNSAVSVFRYIDFANNALGPWYPLWKMRSDNETNPSDVYYVQNIRPIQSPDGTKVAYHSYLLNSETDHHPVYVGWAVAHYPFPAQITSATKNSPTTVRLSFNPPSYTSRTYGGNPVEPKEIKYWHVWVSNNGTTGWTELTTTSVAFATRFYDVTQQGGTTRYYSITSEEHSRLESRRLGNVWKVTLDGSGAITNGSGAGEEQTAYPSSYAVKSAAVSAGGSGYQVGDILTLAGGTSTSSCTLTVATLSGSAVATVTVSRVGAYSIIPQVWPTTVTGGNGSAATFNLTWDEGAGASYPFWTTAPSKPANQTVAAVSKTGVSGQYTISWMEPTDSTIRHYNIYYSNVSFPSVSEAYRIASVPKGISTYLDWCADPNATGFYAITSVDRFGNESGPAGYDTENPVITIALPSSTGSYAINAASVVVSGSGTDDTAVTSVTWVNSLGGSGTASGTDSWSFTCPLQYGVNTVTVTGHDGYSHIGTAQILITRNPPALQGVINRARMRITT